MDINILTSEDVSLFNSLVEGVDNIVIVAHKSPDGDALGSTLALATMLRECYGKQPRVIMPDQYPDFLMWLPDSHTIVRYDKRQQEADAMIADAQLVFCLDLNTLSRTASMQEALEQSKATKVLIDHHLNPDMETALAVSCPEASSTCELVFRMAWQLGWYETLGKSFAQQIYCGLMTDTGAFQFNSSRAEVFYIVCLLISKGIDKDKIYRQVYHNYSQWALRLRGYVMAQRLNVYEDLHASFFSLPKELLEQYKYIKGDVEGLVNEPLTIKGMKLSISLREDDRVPETVWVSLRSVDDFPCNEVAARFFNGGGHKNASGGHLSCSLKEAEQVAKDAIQAYATMLKA